MKIPTIQILGNDLVASAIAVALQLWCDNCPQYPEIPADNAEFQAHLASASLIIAISSPNMAIGQVHHLRSQLKWEGPFLAIVCNSAERQQLENLSMFGELDGKFAYGDSPGHMVLASDSSHLLTDILTIWKEVPSRRMRSKAWNGSLAKSSIYPLLQQISQFDRRDPGFIDRTLLVTVPQLLATIHSLNIDWDSIISHEHARYIRQLKSKYPSGTSPLESDLPDIVTNLQQKFANIIK